MKMEKANSNLCYIGDMDVIEYVRNKIDDIVLELQKVRIAKDISLYKIAQMTGLAHTTIMRIENYSKQPSLEAIMRIAIALDVKLDIFESKHNLQYLESAMKSEDDVQSIGSSEKLNTDMVNQYIESIHESYIQFDGRNKEKCLRILGLTDIYTSPEISFHQIAREIQKNLVFEIDAPQYIDQVGDSLNKYVTICDHFIVKEISHIISQVLNDFKLVLREYYLGQHTSAYGLFSEAMNKLDISSLCHTLPFNLKLYRARKTKTKRSFNEDDFFHVPFEKRTSVSTQRYSFPGLPCLYMGTSVDICLLELNCNNAAVAELQPISNKECNILDLTGIFSCPIQLMSLEDQCDFLKLFPLIYLCSTKIKERNRIITISSPNNHLKKSTYLSEDIYFRPDYIIPQLLLEYILDKTVCTEEPVVGIQYYSVQEDFYSNWLDGNMQKLEKIKNIVVPVRTNRNKGQCQELKAMFQVNRILD